MTITLHRCLQPLFLAVALAVTAIPVQAVQLYHVHVRGLACPFCAYGIEKQFRKLDGVEGVEVHLKSGLIVLSLRDDVRLDEASVKKLVEEAGFTLQGVAKALSIAPREGEAR